MQPAGHKEMTLFNISLEPTCTLWKLSGSFLIYWSPHWWISLWCKYIGRCFNLLHTIESFSFNIGFYTIHKYFSPQAAPTSNLQGKAQDILSAHMGMKSVIKDFENLRENVKSSFNQVWSHSSRLAEAKNMAVRQHEGRHI